MQSRTIALLIIAILMSFGFLAGTFVNIIISQQNIPASHKAIIGNMKITVFDNADLQLTSTYLSTAKSTWLLSTLQENFLSHGTYQYTLWVYSYRGDPEVYVCIWGPGKDGTTFMVELCSSSDRSYTVKYPGLAQDFTGKTYFAVEVP